MNFGEDLIKEMVFSSVCGVPLSVRSSMTAYRLMIQRVHRVATNFDPFGNLVSSKYSVRQCENFRIFLSFIFYVKSILENAKVQKMPFLPIYGLLEWLNR